MAGICFTLNVCEPYAFRMDDGRVVDIVRESEYYGLVDPYKTIPENAILYLLRQNTGVDDLVFLGKPLRYLEHMMSLHAHMFPREYKTFASDIRFFFTTVLGVQSRIRDIVKGESFHRERIRTRPTYYARCDDALAQDHVKDYDLVITCLSEVFEGSSTCIYENKGGNAELILEASPESSFSNILRAYDRHSGRLDLSGFIGLDGGLDAGKAMVRDNRLELRVPDAPSHANTEDNDAFLGKLLDEHFRPLVAGCDNVLFITDVSLPNAVKSGNDMDFITVDDEKVMESAARYINNEATK
ncbi:hypothetical protein ACFLRF_03315 [Candidatus Altiarchaeota archaeon]